MLRKILIVFVVLVGMVSVLIFTRPDAFTIERSATMSAPPSVVYGMIQDFHAWARWSPWARLDPNMKLTIGGPAGLGSTYAWEGNDEVGAGRMTIAELKPDEAVGIALEFLKPMQATNRLDFSLKPEKGGTKVTWRMTGHHDFMGKAFGLVMNMDQVVGKDFERGLLQLKLESELVAREAEAAAAKVAPAEAAEAAAATAGEAVPPDAGTP